MSGNGFPFKGGAAKAKPHTGKLLSHFFELKGVDISEIQQLEVQYNTETGSASGKSGPWKIHVHCGT